MKFSPLPRNLFQSVALIVTSLLLLSLTNVRARADSGAGEAVNLDPLAVQTSSGVTAGNSDATPDHSSGESSKAPMQLQGGVEQNEISGLNSRIGLVIKAVGNGSFPAKVVSLAAESPLTKCGIKAGDLLFAETIKNDGGVSLIVDHGGQKMRISISAAQIAAYTLKDEGSGRLDKLAKPLTGQVEATTRKPLTGQIAATQLGSGAGLTGEGTGKTDIFNPLTGRAQDDNKNRQFKSIVDVFMNHNLALLVDCSMSMNRRDCPGGLSRWEWCCSQATELAKVAAKATSNLDVSIFNKEYITYRNVTPSQIPQIFNENQTHLGTEPAFALQEQMENYFKSSREKPFTIIIVTDGLPIHPYNIQQVLHDEAKKIRYEGEVTVTFLLVGQKVDDKMLANILRLAPGSTAQNGGYVDIIPFRDAVREGTQKALFHDLKAVRLATDASKPSNASITALGPAPNMTPADRVKEYFPGQGMGQGGGRKGGPGRGRGRKGLGQLLNGSSQSQRGSGFSGTPYGSPYGSAVSQNGGGFQSFQNGSAGQANNPYIQQSSAQASPGAGASAGYNPYGVAPQANPYGVAPQSNPYGVASRSNSYGVAPQSNPYGVTPQSNPYGVAPQSNPYGVAPQSNPYGVTPRPRSSQSAEPF